MCLCQSESVCCYINDMCVCVRDKAGGYGIQALGGMLVEYVHGDFLNVVGFPLNHFCKQLDRIYNLWTSSSSRESASVCLSYNGTHTTSVLTQPPSKIPAKSSQSSSSSAKCNSSPSPIPNSPSASRKRQDGPSSSPVQKVSMCHLTSTNHDLFLNIY